MQTPVTLSYVHYAPGAIAGQGEDASQDFDTVEEAETFVVETLKGTRRRNHNGAILFDTPIPGSQSMHICRIEPKE